MTSWNRWAKAATVLGFAGVAMLGLTAQPEKPKTSAADLPEASELFERHIEAIGGRDAVFAEKTRVVTGTYEGPPFTGIVKLRVWAEAPDKMHMQLVEPLGRQLDLYYDGEVTWQQDSTSNNGEPVAVTGPQRVEIIEAADFFGESNYANRYSAIETIGTATFDGKDYYAVRATSQFGRTRRLFFEKESGLFSAEQSPIVTQDKDGKVITVPMEILIFDYQDVGDGVLYPRTQSQKIPGPGGGKVLMKFLDVKVDTGEHHDFSPPPEVAEAYRAAMAAAEAAAANQPTDDPAKQGG